MYTITFTGCYANGQKFATIADAHAYWLQQRDEAVEENARPDWAKDWLGGRIQDADTGEDVAQVWPDGEIEVFGG